MGRARSNMELIKKVKARNATFQKRKSCLKKKFHELAILCGIKAVVIIYGPKQDPPQNQHMEPEIWPENREKVVELISKYKGQSVLEDRKKRTCSLSDFFQERNKKAQRELTKLRSTNVQSKYPTWGPMYSMMQEEQLRKIAGFLEINIENAKAKLNQMKFNNSNDITHACYLQQQEPVSMLNKKRRVDFQAANHANKCFITLNPHQAIAGPMAIPRSMTVPIQQQNFTFIDHYPDQRIINFGNDYVGGVSNVVHDPPSLNAMYNDLMISGTMDSMRYVNNLARGPSMHCYSEGMQPTPRQSMDCHPTVAGSSHHQIIAPSHQDGGYYQHYENCKWHW